MKTSLKLKSIKVVLDTNVLLAGVFTPGVCEAILDGCRENPKYKVFGSKFILKEFERKTVSKFRARLEEAQEAVRVLKAGMELVEPVNVPDGPCRDPNDLAILGTCVAVDADCLVTGDRDLLELKVFHSIPIFAPRVFLDQM